VIRQRRTPRQYPEFQEQKALVTWARLKAAAGNRPLENLFAIPNGGYALTRLAGRRLTEAGLKKGVPDLFLAWPSSRHHGLFIEMKSERGRLSTEQCEMIDSLRKAGYCVEVCWGAVEARRVIEAYLLT